MIFYLGEGGGGGGGGRGKFQDNRTTAVVFDGEKLAMLNLKFPTGQALSVVVSQGKTWTFNISIMSDMYSYQHRLLNQ